MRMKSKRGKLNRKRTKLGLPDLEHAKSAVLVSRRSPESQRSYRRSIDDFVCGYCSEPRLSLLLQVHQFYPHQYISIIQLVEGDSYASV